MARILITPRSLTQEPPRELSILTEAGHELVFSTPGKLPGEAELIELLPGCAGWLAGIEPVSPRVIDVADSLKAVSRNGTGVDNLPLPDLERKGVRVLRAEGANGGVEVVDQGEAVAHGQHEAAALAEREAAHRPVELAGAHGPRLGIEAMQPLLGDVHEVKGALAPVPARPLAQGAAERAHGGDRAGHQFVESVRRTASRQPAISVSRSAAAIWGSKRRSRPQMPRKASKSP